MGRVLGPLRLVSIACLALWIGGHAGGMTGNAAGSAGAGIATNNGTDYITLNVRPQAQAATSTPAGSTPGSATQPPGTAIPLAPLYTVTPYPDGTIVHIVGYGQTLWAIAIAYGVKIDDIRALNGLPEGSTDIYEGQKLIIRLPGPGTPTWDGTQVEAKTTPLTPTPSRTHRPTSTRPMIATRTPKPTLTPSSTATPTRPSLLPFSLPDNKTLGLILLGISGVGILLLLVFGFGKNAK